MGEDQYGIQGAYVILSISFGLYLLIRPVTTYLLRRRLIELGQWNEQIHRELGRYAGNTTENLKWGLILLFTGLGLILNEFLPYSYYRSSLPYGVIAVAASLGFLLYYLIVVNRSKTV
ncbi:hypothetical protein [Larkinella soli]|uniref:hypothetical protein n=1 Tax=Larkinella soli TaxID=1770527 RepID=UPI0013E2C8E2|nr:hypothetical protein [Larkinella soli]